MSFTSDFTKDLQLSIDVAEKVNYQYVIRLCNILQLSKGKEDPVEFKEPVGCYKDSVR